MRSHCRIRHPHEGAAPSVRLATIYRTQARRDQPKTSVGLGATQQLARLPVPHPPGVCVAPLGLIRKAEDATEKHVSARGI